MKRILSSTKEVLTIALLVVVAVAFLIVLLPVIVLMLIGEAINRPKRDKEYYDYLKLIDGTCFFCYNNRRDIQAFIEGNIVSMLDPNIKVIFLNGKEPVSDYEQGIVSRMLYSIQDRRGFPYLIKVCGGQLVDKSINNDVYNTMRQGKNINDLKEKIDTFFGMA
jgi:hypothetical protein